MKDNEIVYSLASVPIYMTDVEVTEDVMQVVKNFKFRKTPNSYVSEKTNILFHENLIDIKNKIDEKVNHYFYEICGMHKSYKPEMMSSWVNIHHYKDFSQSHKHCNSTITGVWYLQTPENCGDLIINTQRYLFGDTLHFNKDTNNEFNVFDSGFLVKKDRLYIFPSHISHCTGINQSKKQRISIAFNYYVRGTVLSENNQMII